MKKLLTSAAIAAVVTGGALAGAAPASACVWDAAWFFLGQCHDPPAAPAPPPPGPPAPLIACDETHCGPDVPIPCYGPGSPC